MAGGEKKPPVVTPEGAATPPPRALTDAEFLELGRQNQRAYEAEHYAPMGPPPPEGGVGAGVPADAGVPPDAGAPAAPYPSPSGWINPPTEPPPDQALGDFKNNPGNLGKTTDKKWQAPPIPVAPPPAESAPAPEPFEVPALADDVTAEPAAQLQSPAAQYPGIDPLQASTGLAAERSRSLAEENAFLRAELDKLRAGGPGAGAPGQSSPPAAQRGGREPGTGIDWNMAGRQGLPGPALPEAVAPGPREPGPGIDIVAMSREADAVREKQQQEAEAARQAALQKEYGGALGMTGAGVYGAARGLTFSLSDPAIALASGGIIALATGQPFGEAYADVRREMEAMREANPGISLATELTTAIVPAVLSGGTSTAAEAARATPVGKIAQLTERAGAKITEKALAKGAGPVSAVMRGMGAAGAAEGAIGGAGAGLAEATYPGNYDTPDRFVEELAKGTATGTLLGGTLGAVIGGGVAKLRGKPQALDEILDEFKQKDLPDFDAEDLTGMPIDKEHGVPPEAVQDVADAMGKDRDALITYEGIRAADTRGKYERTASQVRMATGGKQELKEKLSVPQQQDANKLAELTYEHDQQTSIAAKKKKASGFDEKDGAKPLYKPRDQQMELPLKDVPLDAPESQAAQAEVDEVFSDLHRMIADFMTPIEGAEPITRAEGVLLGRMRAFLAKAQMEVTADLQQGKLGSAFETYLKDVQGLFVKQLDRAVVQDNPRLQAFLTDLMEQSKNVSGFANSAKNAAYVEIPSSYPRSKEVQGAIDVQMGRLHARLDDYVKANYGSDDVLKHDPMNFGIVKRLRDTFNDQHALMNGDLKKGRIGEAYMRFDQGVKAAIGKEAQNAKTTRMQEFLRNLTSEPMNFLEGKNPAGVKVPSVWDRYIDAQDAIARVLNKLDEMKKASRFEGAENVLDTIDRTAGRIRAVIRRKDMTAWQSKGYLDDLKNRIALSVNNKKVWDQTNPKALAVRAELANMLSDKQLWEALSLAESQYIGNKPWARAIHTSDDSAWGQFYSRGPERIPGEWDNLEQANSHATSALFENVGDDAAIRDAQSYLLNLRAIASDAAARQRAWGKNAPKGKLKPDELTAVERTKEIVDIARRMEARVKLMAWANNEAREGAKYLAGQPGLESIAGAVGGAAAGAAFGSPLAGGAAGAFFASQSGKLPRALYRAVAETQAGTDNFVAKSVRQLLRTARSLARGMEMTGNALKNMRAESVALSIARLPSDKKVAEHLAEAKALTDPSSPESLVLLQQTANMEETAPQVADKMAEFEKRRATYVTAKSPSDGRFDPSQTRRMARITNAAYYPERTIKNMSEGVATKEEIEALQFVFPELFRVWSVELDKLLKEKAPKSKQEEALIYRLGGVKMREELDATRMQSAQMWANPTPAPEQPGPGALRSRASQSYTMDPERYTTQPDRIMSGQ